MDSSSRKGKKGTRIRERIADSADALVSKKLGEVTIKQVMELVVACGAAIGSNEHFIASKLFINREQREIFMTLAGYT
ncbi:hypothetical protein U9M48_031840 [Paspalum notatum var. saurae]|uniref:Uncharacterized protein n=1 Tax=Paspalum notatum var. saurae TaxID=547442 RepID=A0AAQ3U4R3_PASNO